MNQWSRLVTATRKGFDAFLRYYSDPAGSLAGELFEQRDRLFQMRWQYYTNEALEDATLWALYKSQYKLYRNTSSLFNPTRRLVDFYAGMIYPGFVNVDGEPAPGMRNAVPLADDTDPALRSAIAQFLRWTNWQSKKSLYVRYGAALGCVLVEVVDDVERGKIYLGSNWPGFVSDLSLDTQGNVRMYELTYDAVDGDGVEYEYRKRVDKGKIVYYRNDEEIESLANPYGFVPAVWVRHIDMGEDIGAPALRNQGKMDRLNSLASHTVFNIHKQMQAPILAAGSGGFSSLFGETSKRAGEQQETPADVEALSILKGPADSRFETIQVSTEEALPMIDKLLAEIEADHPELTFYQQMRDMQTVTGPAASRLMGDVEAPVYEAQAAYDQQFVKLCQMAVAIGGWRLSTGAWPQPTGQQQAFAGFDLDSYDAGNLDFTLLPRPLVPLTALEELEIERQTWEFEQQRTGFSVLAGVNER